MLRPVAPDPGLLAWMHSKEGELWSLKTFRRVRHSSGFFATVKDDHECGPNPAMCYIGPSSPYPDEMIRAELRKYGISGVPREWKSS